uniref:DNA-binding protein n=1 Tax=uncultured Thiotrichaceae bacterium TaxID=298394 RepID=A0A6S6ULR7_9GAMM|nr:MAG: DNA-binding protein [uncultured Thiotrichaceae bacterium]
MAEGEYNAYMSVKQVAEYLQLNEKKVYELVKDEQIPATKVTGKWLFPRGLVDRWLTDSSHGGMLADRLNIAGSDDPLLYRLVLAHMNDIDSHALVNYTATGTRMGLRLLQARRIDACCLHWGPGAESHMRHPALLEQHRQHQQWVLIHLFRREQGMLVHPDVMAQVDDNNELFDYRWRWVKRQAGAGSQRFLMEVLGQQGKNVDDLNLGPRGHSEREAASLVAMGQADVAPGPRAAATEAGLEFVSFGWESFDMALPKNIWFRHLFQELLKRLQSDQAQKMAVTYGGYDLSEAGKLVWGED